MLSFTTLNSFFVGKGGGRELNLILQNVLAANNLPALIRNLLWKSSQPFKISVFKKANVIMLIIMLTRIIE